MSNQKHHIVPIYKCIELGLTTSYKVDGIEFYFKENMVEVTRLVHANIHWGYWCNDLKPLLEVCDPPQWVIDMIPLEDVRDSGAAGVIALGEIEQIDMSGENNPNYKDGSSVGKHHDPEIRRKWDRWWQPINRTKNIKKYRAQEKIRSQRYRDKKKAEAQGVGKLEGFI